MESICELISGLSNLEKGLFRDYLQYSSSRKKENKTILLYDLIVDDSNKSADELMEILYGKPKVKHLTMLKARLRHKLEEFYALDVSVDRKTYDTVELAHIRVKKKMTQFYVLQKSHRTNAGRLLDEIISLAETFEFYPVLVEFGNIKKYWAAFERNTEQYELFNEKTALYTKSLSAVNRAKDLYYEFQYFTINKGKIDFDQLNLMLERGIDELGRYLQQITSPIVNYYFHLLQIFHCEVNESLDTGISLCLKTLKIVEKNKSVYRKERIGNLYDYLCEFELLKGTYSAATNYAVRAQDYFEEHVPNFVSSKEEEFYGRFYNSDWSGAEKVLDYLMKKVVVTQKHRKPKYEYFRACIKYRQGKIKEAMKVINQNQELMSEKNGWNVCIRFLVIICWIDMDMPDEASHGLEALRKHLERLKRSNDQPRKRDLEIYEILNSLMLNSYNFDKTYLETLNRIELLSGNYKDYVWRPWGAELIRFDQWFENKIKVQDREAVKGDAALNKKKEQELPGQ